MHELCSTVMAQGGEVFVPGLLSDGTEEEENGTSVAGDDEKAEDEEDGDSDENRSLSIDPKLLKGTSSSSTTVTPPVVIGYKRKRHSVAGVMSEMADAVGRVADALKDTSANSTQASILDPSPVRKRIAIERLEAEEEDLDEETAAKAVMEFAKNTSTADAYLAMKKPSLRRQWLFML